MLKKGSTAMSAFTDGAVVLLTQNAKCTLLVLEFNEMTCPDLKVTSEAAESESMKGIQDKALLVPDSFGV